MASFKATLSTAAVDSIETLLNFTSDFESPKHLFYLVSLYTHLSVSHGFEFHTWPGRYDGPALGALVSDG
ncbi:hypothetical protein AGIG_G2081 [Arapaima gigas]